MKLLLASLFVSYRLRLINTLERVERGCYRHGNCLLLNTTPPYSEPPLHRQQRSSRGEITPLSTTSEAWCKNTSIRELILALTQDKKLFHWQINKNTLKCWMCTVKYGHNGVIFCRNIISLQCFIIKCIHKKFKYS